MTTATASKTARVRSLGPGVSVVRQRSFSGLTVCLYVLEGSGGLTLIDAGFPNRADEIEEALHAIGRGLESVERVIYTHTHIDHMGGGPALAQLVMAEHVIWQGAAHVAEDWHAHNRSMERWGRWFAELVPPGPFTEAYRRRSEASRGERQAQRSGPTRIGPVRLAHPGERVAAGPFRLEAVPAPGHDPLHVVWVDEDAGVAFSGDVILPVPTPITRPMGDDTATYLATLARLEALPVELAYPGHGATITNWRARIDRSRRFVTERVDAVTGALAARGPTTIFDLGLALAGESARNPAKFPLVLANIDSTVHYLLSRGELVRDGDGVRLA